jgi:thioesterase III
MLSSAPRGAAPGRETNPPTDRTSGPVAEKSPTFPDVVRGPGKPPRPSHLRLADHVLVVPFGAHRDYPAAVTPVPESSLPVSKHRLLVHGFHCDLYGHVNNARYLEFLEAARWQAVSEGLDLAQWMRRGWLFVVVHIDISYRAPCTLGDALEVRTWRGEIGRSSAKVHQRIVRERDARTAAEATVTFVVLDRDRQRPLPIEGEIREGLLGLPGPDGPDGEERR